MAIAHVATSTSQTANTQTNTSLAVTLGSTTAGHLNVIEVAVKVDGTGVDPVIATPAGWTAITSEAVDSGTTSSIGVRAFYRFYVGGDGSTVTVSWTNAGNGVAISSGYSGVNTSNPITGFQVEPKGSTDASYSVTVTTSLAGWVRSGFANRSGHTFSALADTSRGSVLNTSATSMVAQDTAADVAASSYTKTATGSGTTTVGAEWAYGLNSAGGGGSAYSWTITDTTSLTESLVTSRLATVDTYTDSLGLTDTVSRVLTTGTTPPRVPDFTFVVELAPSATPATASPSYVDVTSYVRIGDSATLSRGRENEGSTDAQPGRATWTMDNTGGVFSPNDTGSPYAPFQLRRPFRWKVTVDGISYPLWQGFLDSVTAYRDGTSGRARLSCSDRVARAGAATLPRLADVEIATDYAFGQFFYFPLRTLNTYLTSAAKLATLNFGGASVTFKDSVTAGGTAEITGTNAPPGYDGDPCATFTRASTTSGKHILVDFNNSGSAGAEWTLEAMVNPTAASTMVATAFAQIDANKAPSFATILGLDSAGRPKFDSTSGTVYTLTATNPVTPGTWTHLAVVGTTAGNLTTLYVNGVSVATRVGAPVSPVNGGLFIGGIQNYTTYSSWAPFDGSIAYAGYTTQALSAARIAAHAAAMNGYTGEVATARFARLASAAGVPSSMYLAPIASTTAVGAQATAGRAITDAVNDVAALDAGLMFADSDGVLNYQPARARYNAPVAVTLDAAKVILASSEMTTDDSLLVNDVTYTGNDGAPARAYDSSSITAHDAKVVTRTVPSVGYDGALSAAQWVVTTRAWPTQRSSGIDVNVPAFKAAGGSIPGLLNLEIGSRIQVINMPDELSPTTTLDLFVEGITDRIDKTGWVRTLMTSPVGYYGQVFTLDDPVRGVLDAGNVLGF